MLKIDPIKTPVFKVKEDLMAFLWDSLGEQVRPGHIIGITTKVVSLWEGRVIPKEGTNKLDLIKSESQAYLGESVWGTHLTIKENILLPSAGIDESNSLDGSYILFPENPFECARRIHLGLSRRLGYENFGVLLTDSHTTPLRTGVTGVAVAYYGFRGVDDLRGSADIYDQPLKITQINRADALAVASVLVMGEGSEQTPLVLISDSKVIFEKQNDNSELHISAKDDLYLPLLKGMNREK